MIIIFKSLNLNDDAAHQVSFFSNQKSCIIYIIADDIDLFALLSIGGFGTRRSERFAIDNNGCVFLILLATMLQFRFCGHKKCTHHRSISRRPFASLFCKVLRAHHHKVGLIHLCISHSTFIVQRRLRVYFCPRKGMNREFLLLSIVDPFEMQFVWLWLEKMVQNANYSVAMSLKIECNSIQNDLICDSTTHVWPGDRYTSAVFSLSLPLFFSFPISF